MASALQPYIVTAYSGTAAVAVGGTVTFPYPTGKWSGSFLQGNEVLSIPSMQLIISNPTVAYTQSGIVWTNSSSYAIPANTLLRLQTGATDPRTDLLSGGAPDDNALVQALGRSQSGKLQVVATRGLQPTFLQSAGSFSLLESRLNVRNGPSPVGDCRLLIGPGYSVSSAAAGEVVIGNNMTVKAALEKVSPNVARLAQYNGSNSITITNGTDFVLTDPIPLDFDAGEVFKVQYEEEITVGQAYLVAANQLSAAGDFYRSAVLATGQVGTAGTWSATSRTANVNVGTVTAVLGIPRTPYPSAALIGDSILNGRDDTTAADAFGNVGFAQKALYAGGPGGSAVPYTRLSQSGEKIQTFASYLRNGSLSVLQYVSHVITNLGTNDIGAGRTFAQMQADYLSAWASMKARNVKIYQVLITPRTTSSDSWATLANQTITAGYTVGGTRDLINAWIRTQVGVTIDGVIDPNPYVEDQTQKGKWVVTGAANYATTDGLHPSTNGHNLMSTAVAAVSSTFTL